MKKILIINTTFDKGGAARIAYEIFKLLTDRKETMAYFANGWGNFRFSIFSIIQL